VAESRVGGGKPAGFTVTLQLLEADCDPEVTVTIADLVIGLDEELV
jgi:hypothetical protein